MDRTRRGSRIDRVRRAFCKSSSINTLPSMSPSDRRLSTVLSTTAMATSTLNLLGTVSQINPPTNHLRATIPPMLPPRDPNRNPNEMQNSDRPTTHFWTTVNGYFHREIRSRIPFSRRTSQNQLHRKFAMPSAIGLCLLATRTCKTYFILMTGRRFWLE